ncbi:Fur family transcriptional regulator [Nocardioides plantarum]|uniref:Fur family transcriptional regulator n=1 Tax=Nocardioides plantarum TaxID=29299 RepID=A0ABV5KCY5_9ACTN|nr:Fur family transcriptional regulator [Nocardioides plantarum]
MNQSVARPSTAVRSTRQKRAVEAVMASSDDFRTAQEIHDALRRGGDSVGLATVYRTLQSLVDLGEVDSVKTDGGEAVFRRCSRSHHHHLVCRHCGRTVEIAGPAVERWAAAQAREHGFADVSHTVELFGTCTSCQQVLETS